MIRKEFNDPKGSNSIEVYVEEENIVYFVEDHLECESILVSMSYLESIKLAEYILKHAKGITI